MPWECKIPPETCSKKQNLFISSSCWAIHRARPKQDCGTGVWNQNPAHLISRFDVWVWHYLLKSLTAQEHWWMFRAFCRNEEEEKRNIIGTICISLNSMELFCGAKDSCFWYSVSCIPKRKCSRACYLTKIIFYYLSQDYFPWPESYFSLSPAVHYWIFQGSSISLDLWDEREWQAWLITVYLSPWHQTLRKIKKAMRGMVP